jgi:membrane-bound metal-dependent hydrolase YbcI (DUF457 family)
MDLFTHVIVGYLLSYGLVGFQPQYLAAGALAGGLPDADVIFFPISRRFPILAHHGITHSIFGVTAVALVGGLVFAPMIAPGVPLLYFAVMEAAGLGHMLSDAFTHFSVAPLLPFSKRPLQIDADRAINFVTLVASVTSLFLLGFERFRVPFGLYLLTIYGMMAFYGGYFAIRLIGRAGIARVRRVLPEFNVVAPTANPLLWMLLYEHREGGRHRSGFLRYRLGRGVVEGPWRVDVPLEDPANPPAGPVATASEALERSYPLARRTSDVLDNTYHFAQVRSEGNGCWDIVWYSLEFAAFGRAASVRVKIAADGSLAAKSAWFPVPASPTLA